MPITQVKKYHKYLFAKKFLPLFAEMYQDYAEKEIVFYLKKLFSNKKFLLFVAFDGNKPVAIMGATPHYLISSKKFLQISNFYIINEYRTKGIAPILLKKLEEFAYKKKFDNIELYSYLENVKSQKIYEKMNFKKVGYYFRKSL